MYVGGSTIGAAIPSGSVWLPKGQPGPSGYGPASGLTYAMFPPPKPGLVLWMKKSGTFRNVGAWAKIALPVAAAPFLLPLAAKAIPGVLAKGSNLLKPAAGAVKTLVPVARKLAPIALPGLRPGDATALAAPVTPPANGTGAGIGGLPIVAGLLLAAFVLSRKGK